MTHRDERFWVLLLCCTLASCGGGGGSSGGIAFVPLAQGDAVAPPASTATAPTRPGLQKELVDAFKRILPTLGDAQEQIDELMGNNVPLGVLTDIVSYTLDVGMGLKEQLLHECNVDRRAALLVDYLKKGGKVRTLGRAGFPPEFSVN